LQEKPVKAVKAKKAPAKKPKTPKAKGAVVKKAKTPKTPKCVLIPSSLAKLFWPFMSVFSLSLA
jgi:hypothetical protein